MQQESHEEQRRKEREALLYFFISVLGGWGLGVGGIKVCYCVIECGPHKYRGVQCKEEENLDV